MQEFLPGDQRGLRLLSSVQDLPQDRQRGEAIPPPLCHPSSASQRGSCADRRAGLLSGRGLSRVKDQGKDKPLIESPGTFEWQLAGHGFSRYVP